jgi:hypothetical protein
MAESAALLVDDVLPHEPIRQWVLSFPFQLRFLFASYPQIMGKVLGIVYRTLATHITKKTGYKKRGQVACLTILLFNPSTRVLNKITWKAMLMVVPSLTAKLCVKLSPRLYVRR